MSFHVGILGAGGIAGTMASTIAKMKGVKCYAVGSRTLEKAQTFAKQFKCKKAYGSYEELVADKKVDLVYIATPHSEHYENMKLCIRYKKPILCEKSFTANAEQAEEIFRLAKENNVFVTEAIWTRYMPFLKNIKDVVNSGMIGEPKMLTANLGYPISQVPRLIKPELAGGALLDVGVYPIHFASMIFGSDIEKVTSTCTYTPTGVDEQNSIIIQYKDGRMAVLHSSMLIKSDRKGIIQGSKGFVIVENINNYEGMTVYDSNGKKSASYKPPRQITGYEYEVEACRKALEEGKLSCEEIPHEETLRIMKFMDALRKEWKIVYPFEKQPEEKKEN